MQGEQVQPLVEELRSHMPGGQKTKTWNIVTKSIKILKTALRVLTEKGKDISFFFFLAMPWGIWDLSSQPGMEPVPPAVEAQGLNHWTASEIL